MKRAGCLLLCFFFIAGVAAQGGIISGKLSTVDRQPLTVNSQQSTVNGRRSTVPGASIELPGLRMGVVTDSLGQFSLRDVPAGRQHLVVSALGYKRHTEHVLVEGGKETVLEIRLLPETGALNEVVITGTMKPVNRIESPVPVEVYTPAFFRKNPTPNIFDALQQVNGVRPQLNCNVCNTGDIHINGLEGPYTMILVDGMPIVSSLSTVYGLSGIPNSLVERIEIVKGPASSLYGSEAVGGLINIITKKPGSLPLFSADLMGTTWSEWNTDLALKLNAGRKAAVLTGVNYYHYNQVKDANKDGFTDVTLQKRLSVFQKWNFERKEGRLFSLAGRHHYEDRWGGDTRWTKAFRGGDSIYGESIYTKRWELLGQYQLPTVEKLLLWFSYNYHDQDSRYGATSYNARQHIAFGQITWDKTLSRHDLLAGAALRYTYYVDNTPGTGATDPAHFGTRPQRTPLPGLFLQDEISLAKKHKLLLGMRWDHNRDHGHIFTPRFAYKFSPGEHSILRLNAGTGFRVVNLFTEDHAALTGAREVVIANALKPERSYNVNLNYLKKIHMSSGASMGLDLSAWYTYFTNRIIGDFASDPNKIIYDNLDGFAESRGFSANFDAAFPGGLKIIAGATLMNVTTTESGLHQRPFFTERFTGTWAISYALKKINLGIDYTGNIYGPMRLPLLGDLDPRKERSPTWSLQNIQLTWSGLKDVELYAGLKNLLNWTPNRGNPFLIARAHDPFDKGVQFDPNGQVVATPSNPYALTFDPTYVYAPNQGRRGFFGVRVKLR